MTDTTIPVETVAPTQTPATIQTTEPEVVTPTATEDAKSSPEKPEKSAEQKELEYLRRKATKADRVNARINQELEQYRAANPKPATAPGAQVNPFELADAIATARQIADKSNGVAKAGKERFSATWDQSLSTVISEAGPLIDQKTMLPTPLGEAILDSDDAAALIAHIGSDPSLAEELSELTPAQLGRRIARIEAEMAVKTAKPSSKAPPPINPLAGNTSAANVDLENLPMDKYQEARAKQGARWARR